MVSRPVRDQDVALDFQLDSILGLNLRRPHGGILALRSARKIETW